jgi:hypothetical protein
MKAKFRIAAAALLCLTPLTLSAATPVKVTRFHLNQPIAPGTVSVEIAPDATIAPGPEAALYMDAVAGAMTPAGFTRAAPATPGDYRVVVSISRDVTELPKAPSPVQIGLGGGGGDRGFGLGGSVSFGVGKRKDRALVTTQMSVRIIRSGAPGVIWEGRATQAIEERGKLVQPGAEADKLAKALFRGFPGESGRTISVR